MGIVHAHRGRLAPALIWMVLVALFAFGALFMTENANAKSTFRPTCVTCHTSSTVHGNANHASVGCSSCHVNGAGAAGVAPSGCATCHGGTVAILASAAHTANACGTTPGCHGVPKLTTTVTLRVAPTIITFRKYVKASGVTTPAATLAGKKVSLKVQRKVRTTWVAAKSATATITAAGAYSWKYTPLKRGYYRVRASIAASSTYTASRTAYKTFRVK